MKRDMKICGLKSEEAVRAAVDGGATHIGFIFFPKSPRNIDPADAGALADAVRGKAKVVAVTVDADNDFLDEIVAMTRPDMLQFHGHESPERVLNVKAVYGLPVIKAMPVREAVATRLTTTNATTIAPISAGTSGDFARASRFARYTALPSKAPIKVKSAWWLRLVKKPTE